MTNNTPQSSSVETILRDMLAADVSRIDPVPRAIEAINALIEQEVTKARIDELTKVWAECSADAGDVHKYALDRLQELQSQLKENKEKE